MVSNWLLRKIRSQARDILAGRQSFFWIDDATRTDLAQYPPAFPAFLALIYKLSGERFAYTVQIVLWLIDFFSRLLLIAGIASHGVRLARGNCE